MKNAVRFTMEAKRSVNAVLSALAVIALLVPAAATFADENDAAQASPAPAAMHGTASWYGEEFAGRTTANGEVFEPVLYTAAHRTFPFGTLLDVKNSKTGQTVRVRVNDRGPFVADRLIDLSYAAAKDIGIVDTGSGEVEVTVVSLGRGDDEPPAPYTVTLAQTKSAKVVPPSVRSLLPAAAQAIAQQQPAPETAPPAEAAQSAPAPSSQQAVQQAAAATAQPVQTNPQPAAVEAANPAPQPAAAIPAEPPPVAFPLPTDVAKAAPTGAPAATQAPAPAVVSNVEVIEEQHGTDTRRQVGADGKTIESVSPETGEVVPAAPGHGSAEALDRANSERAAAAPPHAKRFLVQVGAFAQESNAKALEELLTGFGMQCHIDRDKLYRVRMGPFDTREEAIKLRNDLESKGISAIVTAE